jgi:quercetin dioxygenase-like cupin family protein
MKLSRIALAALVVLIAGGVIVSYAAAPGPKFVGTAKFPITVKAGDYDLIAQVVDLPPGGMVPKHTHGGPVVVQVVSGEVTLTDATGSKTVKAGGMFTENAGTVHSAANNGSLVTRLAVSYLIPKGAEVFTVVK